MPHIAIDYDKEKFCVLGGGGIRAASVTGVQTCAVAIWPESDVDVLVTFAADVPWSLANWLAMQRELEALFQRHVDLVERDAVLHSDNRFRKRAILSSAVMLDVA